MHQLNMKYYIILYNQLPYIFSMLIAKTKQQIKTNIPLSVSHAASISSLEAEQLLLLFLLLLLLLLLLLFVFIIIYYC